LKKERIPVLETSGADPEPGRARPTSRLFITDDPSCWPTVWRDELLDETDDMRDMVDRRQDRLAAALAYASRGWPVFPVHSVSEGRCSCGKPDCKDAGKHPRTPHGFKDATTDRDTIIDYWRRWPDANIGCDTERAGLVVIDIDLKNEGDRTWAQLVGELGPEIASTRRSRTGGGGSHVFFLAPEGIEIRGGNNKLGRGADVKAVGGYVLLPGSGHLSGRRYEWEILSPPEPAPLPAALLQRLDGRRQAGDSEAEQTQGQGGRLVVVDSLDVAYILRGVPVGQRDDALFRFACRMRHDDVPQAYAEHLVRIAAARCFNPETGEVEPFPADEAVKKVHRAYALYGPGVAGAANEARIASAMADPWEPVPLSALSSEAARVEWVLRNWLARGSYTLFTALWKSGKTTLLTYMLRCLDGSVETFAGLAVQPAKALVITEESRRQWASRRDRLGIGDHVATISRPFTAKPSMKDWTKFCEHVAARTREHGFTLVVFDTIFNLWPVQDENDNAQINTAMLPLHSITRVEAEPAVLLMAHPKKGDGKEAQATRGGGALAGFVDYIIEMRRYDAEHNDTRRIFKFYGRYEDEMPSDLVLDFSPGAGYRPAGTVTDAKAQDRYAVYAFMLPSSAPGLTAEDVHANWSDTDVSRPGLSTIRADLEQMVLNRKASRTGTGVRGDPKRYFAA
jgi:hypothetical protein